MRIRGIMAASLAALLLVASTSAVTATSPTSPEAIRGVAGTLDVHPLPGGVFDVQDRVFQYRSFPVAGSAHYLSDSRLAGYLMSDWNWDVQASGGRPIPAWGTIEIAAHDGSWSGSFTGIRSSDFQPVDVRAMLFGEGAYEGLCATLDITVIGLAEYGTWVVDGVVHPVEMPA
jgi:hypothetical protein